MNIDRPFIKQEQFIKEKTTKNTNVFLNKNEKLIKLLRILKHSNEILNEQFKVKAYFNAITNIKKLNVDLTKNNIKILLHPTKLVGNKIYKKIEEFVNTGHIKEVDTLLLKQQQYSELLKIRGFGVKGVEMLFKNGITSLNSLLKNKEYQQKLNHNQLLGLRHYKDLNTKIPKNEIKELMLNFYNFIKIPFDIAGSYRRNKEFSSDIDIIIKLEDILKKYNNIENFKNIIKSYNYYVNSLVTGNKKISFLMKSCLTNLIRQVDIIIVQKKEFYNALLYFTGSKEFNEKIRSTLKKKGYLLNEYYLLKNNVKYYLKSEKEIFDILNIKYIKPENRT